MTKRRVTLTLIVALSVLGALILWEQMSTPEELSWDSPLGQTVFWRLRLPRLLLALAAGGLLSVVGAGLQTLFRNPLAEPYTLGIASGAALGAVAAIYVGAGYMGAGYLGTGYLGTGSLGVSLARGLPVLSLAAFGGALGVTMLLIGVSRPRRDRVRLAPTTLLLAGVVISLTCSALILFIQALSDFTQTFRMVRWMMGGLSTVDYNTTAWVGFWSLVIVIAGVRFHRQFDLLLAGSEFAQGRGLDVLRFRNRALVVASLAVGATVAAVGPIGFVGLVVPHLVRAFVGVRHAAVFPLTWLVGGVLLAAADLGARHILAPAELPVGVVTALVGAPVFLWVLLRRVNSA